MMPGDPVTYKELYVLADRTAKDVWAEIADTYEDSRITDDSRVSVIRQALIAFRALVTP